MRRGTRMRGLHIATLAALPMILNACGTTTYIVEMVPDTPAGQVGARSCMSQFPGGSANLRDIQGCIRTIAGMREVSTDGLPYDAPLSDVMQKTLTNADCQLLRRWWNSSQTMMLAMCTRDSLSSTRTRGSLPPTANPPEGITCPGTSVWNGQGCVSLPR
jgi:hypothetical protein